MREIQIEKLHVPDYKEPVSGEWCKIYPLRSNDIVSEWFEKTDGERFLIPIQFDSRINMHDMTCFVPSKSRPCPEESMFFPTLCDYVDNGFLTHKTIWGEEFVFKPVWPFSEFNKRHISRAKEFFKRKGYTVTTEAIFHQSNCYKAGLKSGFRDELHGYHLFTPCKFNPFSITLTRLPESMILDWQNTYEF